MSSPAPSTGSPASASRAGAASRSGCRPRTGGRGRRGCVDSLRRVGLVLLAAVGLAGPLLPARADIRRHRQAGAAGSAGPASGRRHRRPPWRPAGPRGGDRPGGGGRPVPARQPLQGDHRRVRRPSDRPRQAFLRHAAVAQALARTFARIGAPEDRRLLQVTISQLLVHRAGFNGKEDAEPLGAYLRSNTGQRTAFDTQLKWLLPVRLSSIPHPPLPTRDTWSWAP